jgi:hypothetical protein
MEVWPTNASLSYLAVSKPQFEVKRIKKYIFLQLRKDILLFKENCLVLFIE